MVGNIKLSNKLLLAELLKNVTDEKFKMSTYYSFLPNGSTDNFDKYYTLRTAEPPKPADWLHICETTACVAGYACTLWPDLLIRKNFDSRYYPDIRALAIRLGISNLQTGELFLNYGATRHNQIALLERWAAEESLSEIAS